ncbi:MAG: ABC transporter ATP-binding protein [Arenimonas sp.]
MLTRLKKLIDLLTPQERRRCLLLLVMILVMAFIDMLGIASIMPFMAVLTNPGIVHSNQYLYAMYQYLDFSNENEFLSFLGMTVFFMLVGSIAFKALTTYALLRFTHMRNYSLSKRLVAGYLQQPYDWFLNRNSSDLGKTILSEVDEVIVGALVPTMQVIAQGAVVIGVLILLVVVNPLLTLAVAAVLGTAYVLLYWVLRSYLNRIGNERVEANRDRYQIVQEIFGGIKEVKVSGLEGVMLKYYEDPAMRFARQVSASKISSQIPRFALEALVFGGMLLMMLYLMSKPGGLQEALPVLAVYAFAGYRLMPALQNVYQQLTTLRFSGPALDALHADITSLKSDNSGVFHSSKIEPLGLAKCLALEQITYQYPGAERASVKSMDMKIDAFTTVGFVGTTGSGKTTTVDLILGLLQPQNGKLTADGKIISKENLRAWQRSIGYVPQHIYLADASVSANIAFGVPSQNVDIEAVIRAAKTACLHDFVTQDMPAGYDTMVGERGVRLSGGQRQRIGLARALYHDPDILILDEATSALDNLTEQAVMEAVNNLGHRKTIILVAHRLSTVKECDRIFMLEYGEIIGSGRFEELLENNESFRAMASGQMT